MTSTQNFRRQHDAATDLVSAIIDQMDRFEGQEDAYRISLAMAKLLGLLRIHLAQEDRFLYPQLMASRDAKTADLALAFAEEMGGLADDMERFAQRWNCSAAINTRFTEFRHEAMRLFAALAIRIHRENEELYPLAEKMALGARVA